MGDLGRFVKRIISICTLLTVGSTYAQFPESKESLIYSNDFLEVKNPELLSKDFKIPDVKVYSNKELKGKPALELTKEGLKIDGKVQCLWDRDEDTYAKGANLRETNVRQLCKKDIFPFVTELHGKFGQVRVWIVSNDKESASYFSASRGGKTFYIDKKTVPDFIAKKSLGSITEEKYKRNYEYFSKYLAENPELGKLISEFKSCVAKKDFKCINQDANQTINLWSLYFCTNYPDEVLKNYKSHCDDVTTYLCNIEGNSIEYLDCGGLEHVENRNAKLVFKDSKQKRKVENLFWEELKTCFIIDPKLTRLSPPAKGSEYISAAEDESHRAGCSFRMPGEFFKSWTFYSFGFRVDKYGGKELVLYPGDK